MAGPPIGTANEFPLRIRLLGSFAVWLDEQPVSDERWRSRRAASLVKLLALAPAFRLHRDQVIDSLWPGADPSAAANSFHQALYAARQALGPACLRLDEGVLSLSGPQGQPPWVDTDRFAAAARAAASDPEACQAALALYPADLLPDDRYEEWTLQPRAALRQQFLDLLLALARSLEARQDFPTAIAALTRTLVADPASEEAHVALMRLYALSGQRQAALRQFQTLREALRAELDAEPGEPAARLYEAIRSGTFPPDDSRPPEPGGPRHNLPAQLTSFIGREAQLAQVVALLRDQRLVTITGAGGVGKTRLALQAAREAAARFPHGAWLAELAPLADPNLLPNLLVQAMNMTVPPGQDPAQVLEANLRSRRLLLVLDNCEHLIQAAAALAARLLAACPDLRILATSREILGVPGETAFYCPSLSLPGDDSLPAMEQSEAARLFAERAAASQPAFRLDESTAAAVARICRRLDGIPLAIEMAAARARVLPVAQIAARLDDAFHLLTGGSRAALPRHQTLRACIDWSYDLLSPEERALLQRLSVFAGGWTLEAAEQVCADPPRLATAQILDLLGQLADKSLVRFDLSAPGEPRYHLLETVRQYARERLAESGAEAAVRERHLDAFLALALRAGPHLRARGARDWLNRLERELDNIRAALDWALQGPITKGLELASALLWLWSIHNHATEGREWLERLLQVQTDRQGDVPLDLIEKVARGRALTRCSYLYNITSYFADPGHEKKAAFQAMAEESQAIFSALGQAYQLDEYQSRYCLAYLEWDPDLMKKCRERFLALRAPFWVAECDLILTQMIPVDDDQVWFYANEHLTIREEIGDPDGEASARMMLAIINFILGNLDRAEQAITEAIACAEKSGNRFIIGMFRHWLSLILLAQGNHQEALRQATLIQALARSINNQYQFLISLTHQAKAAWDRRDYEQSVRCCEEGLAQSQGQDEATRARFLYILSRVALSQGQISQALSYIRCFFYPKIFEESATVFWFGYNTVLALGEIAALQGQAQRAAIFFGAVEAQAGWLMKLLSPPERSEYEQALVAARAALGEEAFNAAWEAGRAMTVEELISFAREGLDEQTDR